MKVQSKRKSLNENVKKYILNSIYSDDFDISNYSEFEKLKYLRDTFKREYDFNIKRYGEHKAFEEWIRGLPTCFNIEFMNYKILELAKSWNTLPENATEKKEDKIIDNYWNFITIHTFKLFKQILDKPITPRFLKSKVEQTGSYFFTRDTMKFFGDTMTNYGVKSTVINDREVWELYRKRPVKHGLKSSTYFDKITYEKVYC